MTHITDLLQSIGFSKNEALVYLELIKVPYASALEISKKTGIHRPNTYDSLRRLKEKGFVAQINKDDKNYFIAVDPEKIKNYLHDKEEEFESILPSIKKAVKEDSDDKEVFMSGGVFAAREALLDLLKFKEPILAFGASRKAVENFGEGFLDEFHKQRIKKKIPMFHIYNPSAVERVSFINKMRHTHAKCLPKKYDTTISTAFCKDTVLLLNFLEGVFVIKIKSQQIADTYKRYFELMWRMAK